MQISRNIFRKFFLLLIAIFTLFFVNSCNKSSVENTNANQNTANTANPETTKAPKDNVEELSSLIKLPEMPEEAVWREEDIENPKGKKLTAVLKYSQENIGKIAGSAENNKPPAPVQIGTEDWFPDELTAQTQLSGNETLKGTAYGANDFYNPPYQNGKLIKIQDTNYFILELTTY